MIKIAALKNNEVINIYLYDNMEEAVRFHEMGAFVGSDNFVEASNNTEAGDLYDSQTGEFSKPFHIEDTTEPDQQAKDDLYAHIQTDFEILYLALAEIYEKIGAENNG